MKPELIRQRAYSYLRFAEESKDLKDAARLRYMGGEYLVMADLAEEDNSRKRRTGMSAMCHKATSRHSTSATDWRGSLS